MDDNEKIIFTNLPPELINQELADLNYEHVSNQISKQPITNSEYNNTYRHTLTNSVTWRRKVHKYKRMKHKSKNR